ncbi:hypothetical protein IT570_00835 [Candidatus Sumerlaeota bacterium]|nr:hypothetical protein [Candidatus Sumerlaeota bacterium]
MELSLVPIIALVFINLCVVAYVVRQSDRSRSGFFLFLNALSLIMWSFGKIMAKSIPNAGIWFNALPYLSGVIIPGNMLYYALTRPRSMGAFWSRPAGGILIFAPGLIITLFQDYTTPGSMLFDYNFWSDTLPLGDPMRRAAMLYMIALLVTSVAVLGIRYHTANGPEKNISKHLIATILGPLFFASSFWISSREPGPALIPSPSMVVAFMAQLSLIAVLRQEEIDNPRLLSRIVFYGALVLVAFIVINLASEVYIYVKGGIVLDRVVTWMLIGAILIFFLAARLSLAERTFDELMFRRASEYRKLIEDTRTELRDARERLLRSEKLSAVGELAARVAHEIKNPLGPIKGYTQMMREKLEADTEFRHRDEFLRHLDVIAEEVENIDRRIHQFLNASRQPQLMIEPTNINRIVDRCGRILNLEIAAAGDPPSGYTPVAVRVQLDENATEIDVDSGRIEEAIFNLARNALEAVNNESGGYIRMKTTRYFRNGEEGILVTVQDSGPGFSTESIERLFEPFYTSKRAGTGLGLAIVRSTIEAHGGTIELGNRKEGGGEALIWLPYHPVRNPGALLPKA